MTGPLVPEAAPGLVVHADWSSTSAKRWMCVALKSAEGYKVEQPEPVGTLPSFWRRLLERSGGQAVVTGFDFPIGVPTAYAERASFSHFRSALMEFGSGAWSQFYELAEVPAEVNVRRPFYPRRPGGTSQQHLVQGLGVPDMRALLRRCDGKTKNRGPASPLFWTLGGKQVGQAAIVGWRDLLAPGLSDPEVDLRLWPFDGSLSDLLAPGAAVVTETYPAEACVHLGLRPPGSNSWSKTTQEGRRSQADLLLKWAANRPVTLRSHLVELIRDGFGPDPSGDDSLDAVIGMFSMLEVFLGYRNEGSPLDSDVRQIEGWILGQQVE